LPDEEFLHKLNILIDGKVSYGGLLAFGTEDAIQQTFCNHKIDYLEIRGTSYGDAPERYTYRLTSEGNLYDAFFDIYDRLYKKIEIPFKLEGPFRDDNPPQLKAVREALVNLLMHSDFFSNGSPRIRVFTDRIEFFNPGCLPKRIEDIIKEDFSFPRNFIIAKVFRFIKLAENIGSGFHKMIEGWSSHYKVKPIIEGSFDYYKITFPFAQEKTLTNKGHTTQETTQKTTQKIIDEIKVNPYITRKELAKKTGKISEDGIKYHLNELKRKGILKRVGPDKGGYWEIIK
jgi:ATP-dependent DNA helicase RecG